MTLFKTYLDQVYESSGCIFWVSTYTTNTIFVLSSISSVNFLTPFRCPETVRPRVWSGGEGPSVTCLNRVTFLLLDITDPVGGCPTSQDSKGHHLHKIVVGPKRHTRTPS